MTKPLDFYGGPLSNFVCDQPILLPPPWGGPDMEFATVEHWFQASKATNLRDFEWVRNAYGPREAKKRGRQITLRSDWEDVKVTIMLTGLRAKFAPGTAAARMLILTGDQELREDSPTDFVWGWRNGGQNLLGKALMKVRAELQAKGEQ